MKVVIYDQLDDPYGFIKLMEPAFGWTATPTRIARMRRLDQRYKDTFGFAALDKSRLVGFVGVMDIRVRTLDRGVETIGGIHGVATDPNFARTGIATRLFPYAHRHFRRKGYRFSFLCTGRNLVGHNLYRKLGYTDTPLADRLTAYRIYRPRKAKRRRKPKRIDYRRMERVFAQVMKDRTGFSVRFPHWARIKAKMQRFQPGSAIIRPGGYALFEERRRTIEILDFHAVDRAAYQDVLSRVKARGKAVLWDPYVSDPMLEQLYRDEGCEFRRGRWFTVMCKPLARTSFDRAFGDRFAFTWLDVF
ncbi:MAG: GNAT family N-acetyltransferase [candidate division WOR-3 bacterium]|nr:MAG: GNAT family N-acetyltransferase [candidate division WOR-3 bacterium]